MRRKFEKFILKIYQLLPEFLQNNQHLIDYVSPIAEKRLQEVKHEVLRANWEVVQLEKTLARVKDNK